MLKSLFGLKRAKEQEAQRQADGSANTHSGNGDAAQATAEPPPAIADPPKKPAAQPTAASARSAASASRSAVSTPHLATPTTGGSAGSADARAAQASSGASAGRRREDQDVAGSIFFLHGKLKEMTDLVLGPDVLRQKRVDQTDELLKLLRSLLRGEDEDTEKVRRGRSLNDASRHRPDLDADTAAALARFTDPRLAALRRFPSAAADRIALLWQTSPIDYLLASTVVALLQFLEEEYPRSREVAVLRSMVASMTDALRGIISNMSTVMALEPDLVWVNMRAAAEKAHEAGQRDAEEDFKLGAVVTWLREREGDIIGAMRANVEALGPLGEPLWGRADARGRRERVCCPAFNFLDFVVGFVDYVYEQGYVFKPSARPPVEWSNEEVVSWVRNLRLGHLAGRFQSAGVTGLSLLEASQVDLEDGLDIKAVEDRRRLAGGLQMLRRLYPFEPMRRNERETRELIPVQVPEGATAGGTLVVADPTGRQVTLQIPDFTEDRTRRLRPGMQFRYTHTHHHAVQNKWQAARNEAIDQLGGCLARGVERTPRNLWRGAFRRVKLMNRLESRLARVLRINVRSETLRLTAMDLQPSDAPAIRDFLLVNIVLAKLEMSYNRIGPRGMALLANGLRDNRTVSELRMASNEIGDEGGLSMADVIRGSESLSDVDLGNNGLTDRCGPTLLAAAGASPARRDKAGLPVAGSHRLMRLMVYTNGFGPHTMAAWAELIKKRPLLQIDMTDNPAGDGGVACVAAVLRKHWTQPRLDLRALGFGPAGLRPVALQLGTQAVTAVGRLFLGGNRLGPEGGEHLALLLETNWSIAELDVSGCELLDPGVRHIAKALATNDRLELLDLGDNGVTDIGVGYLATVLSAKGRRALRDPHLNPFALKRLVLSGNPITSEGFGLYGAAVTASRMARIEMSACRVTDEGCRFLSHNLTNNKTLQILDLSSNLLTADGLWVLAAALRVNESLQIMRINDNRVQDAGARAMASVLKQNRSIVELNIAGNGISPRGAVPLCTVLERRQMPIEVWLHGNPCLQDSDMRDVIDRLESVNRLVRVHR